MADLPIVADWCAVTGQSSPERTRLRHAMVHAHLPLVRRLSARYGHRGEAPADLIQVGSIGLIKAIDGFDPARERTFIGYAIPTILGEIKRHFRDHTWFVHVPRHVRACVEHVRRAQAEFLESYGREATERDLCVITGLTADEVRSALDAQHARTALPLESAVTTPTDATTEGTFRQIDDHESLRHVLALLPSTDRGVVVLRFWADMTQQAVADHLGMTQPQVSRIEGRSLHALRIGLEGTRDFG